MSGEQAIFNLEIKKKSGLSLNPDIYDDPYVNVSGKPYLQKVHNWTYLRDILFII